MNSIKISLKFVPKGQIDNIPSLFQIMAWRRPGDKPLSETMMVSLLTHICVTRPQWVINCDYHTLKFPAHYNPHIFNHSRTISMNCCPTKQSFTYIDFGDSFVIILDKLLNKIRVVDEMGRLTPMWHYPNEMFVFLSGLNCVLNTNENGLFHIIPFHIGS